MKAIVEFDLPEDTLEHVRCVKVNDILSALYAVGELVRVNDKAGDVTTVRSFYDILDVKGVDLDELWS